MHVMFVVNDLNYFAIHRHALALAWLEKGWRVTLLSGDAPYGKPHIDPRIALRNLPLERHHVSPMRDLACLRIVLNAIRTERPDMVHAFTIKAVLFAGLAVMLMRRKPALVLTFAGLGKIFEPTQAVSHRVRRTIVVKLLQRIERACSHWATFENENDRKRAIELGFVNETRSQTVQGAGIDPDLFYPSHHPHDGELRILMASRLIATKGVDVFIAAAQRLKGRARFTLTGPRDDGDADAMDMKVIEEAARNRVIEWRGATPVKSMGDLLREHDLVVLPTRLQEGFPRSLLEAAACGCALVATRQRVIEQIVQTDRTGWLLPTPDADHLVDTLREAIADPQRTRAMGVNAARLVSQMAVDTHSVVRDMHAVYVRAAEGRAMR